MPNHIKNFLLIFAFYALFWPGTSYAQKLTGTVLDEDKVPLEFASVALLQPQDSLLVKYTSTDKDGKFLIPEVKSGNYLFQVYLMTYQVHQRMLDFPAGDLELEAITLDKEINTLGEVEINAVIPIQIKQDTMAFNTKAFKVKQDDNVEDLIKKLPGVEVENDGTVNAQGEEVTKILVDGKEFFNNDPQIALKNLTAEAIKSVEIIDEESDDTRTTGIQDGETKKIINLVLKEGKKSGYFGKAGVGAGTEERYTSNFDINRFTKNTQMAVFGNLNNINNTGATIWRRDGGRGDNSGFLTTGTAGANFNYEVKKDYDINMDYFYGHSDREQEEVASRTEFRNSSTFSSERDNSSQNISNNHNVNFSLRNRSIKDGYLELRGRFKKDDRTSDSNSNISFFDSDGNQDTDNFRVVNSEDDRSNGSLNFSYRKKYNELGRNLRIMSGLSFVDNDDMNYQVSQSRFNISDQPNYYEEEEITERHEMNKEFNYNFSIRFMEPIVRHHFIYGSTSVRNELREEDLDQTRMINDVSVNPFRYMIDYGKEVYHHEVGYVYSLDVLQIYLAGGFENMKQKLDYDSADIIDKSYDNFLPTASINYEVKKGTNIRFRYRKQTLLPSANQVTPAVNNFNPLYITYGNIDLTPEKSDNYNIRLRSHNFQKGTSMFSFLNYTKTENAIVPSREIFDDYRQESTYENFGSRSNFRGMLHWSRKIPKLGMRYNVFLFASVNDYNTIINTIPNKTKTRSNTIGINIGNDNKNKVDLQVGARFETNKTRYSTQGRDRDFFRQNYNTRFDIDITNNLSFNTQFDYSLYTDDNFDSQNEPIWNMAVEYAFLKGMRGNLKFQVIDILDKNIGLVRTSTDNYYEEAFRTNLGTYALLTFTYNIKPPTGKESKRDNGDRRRHFQRRRH